VFPLYISCSDRQKRKETAAGKKNTGKPGKFVQIGILTDLRDFQRGNNNQRKP
jgi:hypothetical protein